MTRILVLAVFAVNIFVGCVCHHVSNTSYQPASKPEGFEFAHDKSDVYPDDVRKDLNHYTNAAVIWTGVIVSTDAYEENESAKIVADTILEHHYFNWAQTGKGKSARFSLSPRGEGLFHIRWHMDKTTLDSSYKSAEKYAAKGRLAIVYGVPESVGTNGTVSLKYRYLRIIDREHFTTNEFDYGRAGEPFHALHSGCAACAAK